MTQDRSREGTDTAVRFDQAPGVAPSKPRRPVARAAEPEPQPIDLELEDDVRPPHPGPDADEVLPEARSPFAPVEDAADGGAAERTSVELLGAAAAANASLSARGARTPLAGVPVVDGAQSAVEVEIADQDAPFVPRFAPVGAARVRPARRRDDARDASGAAVPLAAGWEAAARDADAAPTTNPDPERDAPAELPPLPVEALPAADTPLYRPRVAPGEPVEQAEDGDEQPPEERGADERPRDPGRTVPLVIVGLVILALVTGAVAWALLRPETVELPAQRVVASPEAVAPAVEPIAPTDPTPFLAAMPTSAGPWALTAAETGEALTDAALPGRVAEVHTLTYEDGVDTVAVVARQLYTADDALAALTAAAGEGATLTEHTVGSTAVGSQVELAADGTARVLWTNGAAYFEAEGPAPAAAALIESLGL